MNTITIDDITANTKEWLIDKSGSMSKDDVLQSICNIYNELHNPQCPKTYEECCEIIHSDSKFYIDTHLYSDKLESLYKLLICRDAYWKIAGEQMGLGKPWKPDWANYENMKYIIGSFRGEINCFKTYLTDTTLAFPTKEMRDAFYYNFKDLIEECKQFL